MLLPLVSHKHSSSFTVVSLTSLWTDLDWPLARIELAGVAIIFSVWGHNQKTWKFEFTRLRSHVRVLSTMSPPIHVDYF